MRAASWTAIEPTPPAAADTTTTSPLLGATARTHATAAAPATNREPATSHVSSGGFAMSWVTGTETSSAWLDRSSDQPSTASPDANWLTPPPTATTSPARSLPCPDGNVEGNVSAARPTRTNTSPGLILAAFTATTTRPGDATGSSTSRTSRTSSPPKRSYCTAFTRRPPRADPSRPSRSPVVACSGCLCPPASRVRSGSTLIRQSGSKRRSKPRSCLNTAWFGRRRPCTSVHQDRSVDDSTYGTSKNLAMCVWNRPRPNTTNVAPRFIAAS